MAEGLSSREALHAKWLRRSQKAGQSATSFPPGLVCVVIYTSLHIHVFFYLDLVGTVRLWAGNDAIVGLSIGQLAHLTNVMFAVWLGFDFYAWLSSRRKKSTEWLGAYLLAFVLLFGMQLVIDSWRLIMPHFPV